MNKNIISKILIIYSIISFVTAQNTVETPIIGSSYYTLYKMVENNVNQTIINTASIKNMLNQVEVQNTRFITYNIFGTSMFMLFLFSIFMLLKNYSERKYKISREKYIKQLEDALIISKKRELDNIDKQNQIIGNFNNNLQKIYDLFGRYDHDKEKLNLRKEIRKNQFIAIITAIIGFIVGLYYG